MNWTAVAWTLIALFGVYVSVRGLADNAADSRAIGDRDGAYRLLITTRSRRAYIRLAAFVVYAVIGVDALAPLDFPGEQFVVVAALLGGLLALVVTALLEQVDRAMIRRMFP